MKWIKRFRDICIRSEPPVPSAILDASSQQMFATLPSGGSVCIKVSAAYDLPYPFAISSRFAQLVVDEIIAVNSTLKIILTEGGVGDQNINKIACQHGLYSITNAIFLDAEATEAVYVPNSSANPYSTEGFCLPSHWVDATARVSLTTCKVRSHHFSRIYSGGVRNFTGLLPRAHYRLTGSKRDMRSALHSRGINATIADLYNTIGKNVLTILDGRLIARQDEHLPIRFTKTLNQVVIASDPLHADKGMLTSMGIKQAPAYLEMIDRSTNSEYDSKFALSLN